MYQSVCAIPHLQRLQFIGMEVAVAERIEEHHLAVVAQESNHPLYSPKEEVPLHK